MCCNKKYYFIQCAAISNMQMQEGIPMFYQVSSYLNVMSINNNTTVFARRKFKDCAVA